MAKQPLPPQVVCQILGLDEETVKAAFEAGNPPVASQEQLLDAVKKSVDLEDSVDMYKPVGTASSCHSWPATLLLPSC